MSQKMDKFLLVLELKSSLQRIYYYEFISINDKQNYKVETGELSSCFKIYPSARDPDLTLEFSDKWMFNWYDEKYLCASSLEVYEKACELKLPEVFIDWLATRL